MPERIWRVFGNERLSAISCYSFAQLRCFAERIETSVPPMLNLHPLTCICGEQQSVRVFLIVTFNMFAQYLQRSVTQFDKPASRSGFRNRESIATLFNCSLYLNSV